jgi:glutamate synthase (ferredoxin)
MRLKGKSLVLMGNDTAVLPSDQPQLLYNYFKQLFAQVTNPPLMVFVKKSLRISAIGGDYNIFDIVPNIVKLNQKSCYLQRRFK